MAQTFSFPVVGENETAFISGTLTVTLKEAGPTYIPVPGLPATTITKGGAPVVIPAAPHFSGVTSWSLGAGSPPWASINPATGNVTLTPPAA